MKLEVGMYVRSKINGLIGKIANIEKLVNEKGVLYYELEQKGSGYGFCSTEIDSVIASFNIIDLIEAGDYVNGAKVNRLKKDYIVIHEIWSGREYLSNEEIKTIVTKEQFEQMSYKV